MSEKQKNRLFFVREKAAPEDPFQIKKNRIKRLLSGEKNTSLIITLSVVIVAVAAILLIINYYKKPDMFTSSDKGASVSGLASGNEVRQLPEGKSDNLHIEKGKNLYFKGYYTNAISEFQEVIDSGASDQDKAVALTYIGIIHDDRQEYDKAIEYYKRALNYDKNNPLIYRNLALAYRHANNPEAAIEAIRKGIGIDDKNIDNFLLLGNIFYEQGKYDDAVSQYKKALDSNPDNAAALHNLAQSYLITGDEVLGIEYLKKAASADKIGKIAQMSYSKLGVIYTSRQDYEFAEKYLKMAVSINPNDPVDRYNLGIVYFKQNKPDKAIEEFEKAGELGRNDAKLLESLGEAYYSLKEYDKSADAYNRLLEINKRNVGVLSRLGEIYYEKGDLEKSLDLYQKITVLEPVSENARVAYLNMGNIMDDAGRPDEAIEMYEKALAIDGKDDSVLYNMGIAYQHAGKPELAIQSWRKALSINPDKPDHQLAIAKFYYEKRDYDMAIDEYQKILRHWPEIQEAHFDIAGLYYKKNLIDYAVQEYKRVIEINDKTDFGRKAYINLGTITAETSKEDDEKTIENALSYTQRALLIKPGDPEALFSLGLIYSKKKMYDKAIETFYQVITASRESKLIAESYNNIGKSYFQQGLYRKAMQAFTRGIEEEPTIEEIRINRKVAMQAYEEALERE